MADWHKACEVESRKPDDGMHRRCAGRPAGAKADRTTVSLGAKLDSRVHRNGDAANEVNASTVDSGAWRTGL
ncbi:hypothetical protein BUPH_08562 [Paraburkholderia phenoliruptrix BR3459a]|uniref:Uncharacterized protein n=1 Tax=Paraburkholderia phenoliruptrix BR3459a TaxID=1229205 RepID=K0DMQ8_9BURK|nr:hypothetical protein BUPH_08562 [Paraburkholderia phenoliruptrix BR3459a]